MSHRLNPNLLLEIQKYGAANIEACFNCGNCTAVCPLADDEANFPRKVIRYAQIGAEKSLLSSKELWLCYYCGECSTTCPRQAEPGEFMAAARRFAIANYDVTGLAKRLYRSAWFNIIITVALAIFFSLFLLSFNQGTDFAKLTLWEFIPEVYVQILGLAIFGVIGLVGIMGVVRMTRDIYQAGGLAAAHWSRLNWPQALRETLAVEVLGHKNYRNEECGQADNAPWFWQRWFVHAAMMYGFGGLFAATALDFLFKPVGSVVPLYYPMRLLGTIAGLFFMYGTSVAIYKRLRKQDKSASYSQPSDWIFLILLWLVGLTGFLLEIAVYAPPPATWGYTLLIIHVVLAMDLLVLLPFSKFAHVFYRTVAIFVRHLKPVEQTAESGLAAAEV